MIKLRFSQSLLLIIVAFLIMGFGWPGSGNKKKENPQKTAAPKSSVVAKSTPLRAQPQKNNANPTGDAKTQASAPDEKEQIAQLQNQIQDVLRANQALKPRLKTQAAEMLRIQEQAKLHQRILNNIKIAQPQYKKTDADAILRQQKIRLIQEQTARNSAVLRTMQQANMTAVAEATKLRPVKESPAAAVPGNQDLKKSTTTT